MNRAILLVHLEQAKALVAADALRIARQEELIHHLNRDSPCGVNAEEYLNFLEGMRAVHVTDQNRLERGLATANPE